MLQALNVMKECSVCVIFERECLDIKDIENSLMISIIESLAQAENESCSDNINEDFAKEQHKENPNYMIENIMVYKHNENGKLIIGEEMAHNVKLIFELYLSVQRILSIIRELERRKIISPTGKEKWCKRTIDVMLSNEKYMGEVRLLKSVNSEVNYLSSGNNPAIISREVFETVQIEKKRRSNVVKDKNGNQCKCKNIVKKKY